MPYSMRGCAATVRNMPNIADYDGKRQRRCHLMDCKVAMTREIQTIANIGSGTMGHATAHCDPDLRFAVRRNGMRPGA